MEKKPWYKKVLGVLGAFFGAIITFIFFGTINRNADDNRRRTKPTRDNLDKAEAANRDAEDRVISVEELNRNINECNDECQAIIRNVRERNKKR